jgi:fluoride exporter
MSPRRRPRSWVVPAIALGGMIGASGRYALELAWPHPTGALPWATLVTNASGCLLIGALMVYVVEVSAGALRHPLVRPFLGVGVLGGYTTFSTYTVQSETLVADGRPLLAIAYLFGTLAAALAAVVLGVAVARALAGRRSSGGAST